MAILQNLRPLLFVTFPQGFQIHKNLGHWTSRTGGKKTVKQSEKSVMDRQINKTKKIRNGNILYNKKDLLENSKAYSS